MISFTVLHVCLGNICRSPMAERLLAHHLAISKDPPCSGGVDTSRSPRAAVRSHSAGTGDWHVGQPMEPGAARTLRERGADDTGFRARHLTRAMVDESDLVLAATWEQVRWVVQLVPAAAPKTFVLGEFGRLLSTAALTTPAELVQEIDAARGGARSLPDDDLFDPYGKRDREFARCADLIEATIIPLAAVLNAA